jgi:hypothetical protein
MQYFILLSMTFIGNNRKQKFNSYNVCVMNLLRTAEMLYMNTCGNWEVGFRVKD